MTRISKPQAIAFASFWITIVSLANLLSVPGETTLSRVATLVAAGALAAVVTAVLFSVFGT